MTMMPNVYSMMLSSMFVALAATLSYFPRRGECVVAFFALAIASLSPYSAITGSTLAFWGIATALVLGINALLPRHIAEARNGIPYIATASFAAMMVGLTFATSATIIIGSAIGALLGALAFAKTNSGKSLNFPSRQFFNYLAAKGLPIIVTASIIGVTISELLKAGGVL